MGKKDFHKYETAAGFEGPYTIVKKGLTVFFYHVEKIHPYPRKPGDIIPITLPLNPARIFGMDSIRGACELCDDLNRIWRETEGRNIHVNTNEPPNLQNFC